MSPIIVLHFINFGPAFRTTLPHKAENSSELVLRLTRKLNYSFSC